MYAQAMIIEGVKRQLQPPPGLPSQRFPTARYVFQRLESWAASKTSPKAQPTLEAVAVSMANAIEENFAPATEPSMEISSLLWARFPAVPQALCTGCEKQRPSPPGAQGFPYSCLCSPLLLLSQSSRYKGQSGHVGRGWGKEGRVAGVGFCPGDSLPAITGIRQLGESLKIHQQAPEAKPTPGSHRIWGDVWPPTRVTRQQV